MPISGCRNNLKKSESTVIDQELRSQKRVRGEGISTGIVTCCRLICFWAFVYTQKQLLFSLRRTVLFLEPFGGPIFTQSPAGKLPRLGAVGSLSVRGRSDWRGDSTAGSGVGRFSCVRSLIDAASSRSLRASSHSLRAFPSCVSPASIEVEIL